MKPIDPMLEEDLVERIQGVDQKVKTIISEAKMVLKTSPLQNKAPGKQLHTQ